MEKQTTVIDLARDGTLKLPLDLRRNLGNPHQLGVTRVGSSLVLAPIPEAWMHRTGRVIHYENGLIVRDPKVMFGTPVIAGTRISVRTIAGYTQSGCSPRQIQKEFPHLTPEQIRAAIKFYRTHRNRKVHTSVRNTR